MRQVNNNLIINVALTGCVHSRSDNLNLPISPNEVAKDARRCWNEGATMFHIHARDAMGNPAWGKTTYQRYIDAVKEEVPDAVIVASCSGRHFSTFRERSGAIQASPDMASLTLGSFNFRNGDASINKPIMIEALAKEMREHGVKPELEVFEIGQLFYLDHIMHKGIISTPFYVNLFLGNWIPAKHEWLVQMVDLLPHNAIWAGAGLGRFQFEVNKWAIALGGHVRVGLEDSLWMDRDDPASNPRMVQRIVEFARLLNREPGNAREILCL